MCVYGWLQFDFLPRTPSEEKNADQGYQCFRYDYCEEYTFRTQIPVNRQEVSERYLECPKTKEINHRRGPGVSRTVECIGHNHSDPEKDITQTDYTQSQDGNPFNPGIPDHESDD